MNKLFISSIRERKARKLPRAQYTDKKWRAGWHTSKSVFLAHAQSKALPVEAKRVLEVAVFFRQFFDWQLHDTAITAIAVGSVEWF